LGFGKVKNRGDIMVQTIGGVILVVAALLIAMYWIWSMWLKGTTTNQSSTATSTSATSIASAAVDTTQLTLNLGYVEVLSKVGVISASPDAVKACDVLADVLWQGAMAAWKAAQIPADTTAKEIVMKTVKITALDGQIVEVPVQ
jgi:hypothetical protein